MIIKKEDKTMIWYIATNDKVEKITEEELIKKFQIMK